MHFKKFCMKNFVATFFATFMKHLERFWGSVFFCKKRNFILVKQANEIPSKYFFKKDNQLDK